MNLFEEVFPPITFPSDNVLLLCALPADQTTLPKGHPLWHLGNSIAQTRNWAFHPFQLQKRVHKALGKAQLSRKDRLKEVYGAYTYDGPSNFDLVVILDDYCSTGATMAEIARAVKASNTDIKAAGLALARSRSDRSGKTMNNHLRSDWGVLWDGEEE